MIANITIGADPEIFFVEARTNIPRSAEGLIGGDKFHPVPMDGLPEGFMVQEDNVAAEFNIPPATTQEQFTSSIFQGVKYVQEIAKANKLKLAFVPELDFPLAQLQTEHCQTLGCNPDFNSWTEEANPQPVAPLTMRTAAGHVHIGWYQPQWLDVLWVARLFDLYVTVPSILVTTKNRRRELYGKAGACRPKQYGVECRSADNFWVNSKKYMNTMWDNIFTYINLLNEDRIPKEAVMDYADLVFTAINLHDREAAQFLVNKFNIRTF